MRLDNDFQDDQVSSKNNSSQNSDQPLRRHQAQDEKYKSLLGSFKRKHRDKTSDVDEKINQSEYLSRSEQKRRDKDENNERKARELGQKLNKVIWILVVLIIFTYLVMKFVNF